MNKDVADLWIKALRSGNYKQTESKLERNGNFCCLGVLCKVAQENNVEVLMNGDQLHGGSLIVQKEVIKWSGVRSLSGVIKGHLGSCLTAMNDSGEYDFKSLANVIEENWETL